MGFFDRFKKQEEHAEMKYDMVKETFTNVGDAQNYFMNKFSNPAAGTQTPYEAELFQRIFTMQPEQLINVANQFSVVDAARVDRGMSPLDVKETNLSLEYMERGLNLGSFGMEKDYHDMVVRIDQCKWQIGEGAPQFAQESVMPEGDSVLQAEAEVNIKTSHAEELTPEMSPWRNDPGDTER